MSAWYRKCIHLTKPGDQKMEKETRRAWWFLREKAFRYEVRYEFISVWYQKAFSRAFPIWDLS
jgi:hypothetical protein